MHYSMQVYTSIASGPSHVVDTAWALIALLVAEYHKRDCVPLDNAARFLMSMQQPNGDWPQQRISGVFNRNCMITYANYRCVWRDAWGPELPPWDHSLCMAALRLP